MERARKTAFHEPIRPSTTLVRIQPPKVHSTAYITGGLRTLYKKISLSKNRKLRQEHDFGAYTDNSGCFVPEEPMPLLASRYRYLEILGKGNSSILLKAEDTFRRDNNLVSIKILHVNYHALGYQEADCIRRLNLADPEDNSRCVRLLNFFTFDDHYCMVFELLNPTPLHHYFRKLHEPQEKLATIRKVAVQLLQVLGFLLRGNVIHADLKPENVLAVSGDLDNVKVIDFGNAIHAVPEEISLYYDDFELQTLLYRAPEVMMGLPDFALEIDMWSLGCILAELYIGKPLFFGMSKREILMKMTAVLGPFPLQPFEEGKFFPELREFVSVHGPLPEQTVINRLMGELDNIRDFHFASFLAGLLKYNPRDRMTPAQAAAHPFLAKILGMRYLMPANHPISRTFYPAVGVNPTSYRQRPFVERDVTRQPVRSDVLLRMGTRASPDPSPASRTHHTTPPPGKHRSRSRPGSGGSSGSSQNSTPRQSRIPQPSLQHSNNNNNQPAGGGQAAAVQYQSRHSPQQHQHGQQEVQKYHINTAEQQNVQYNTRSVQYDAHSEQYNHSMERSEQYKHSAQDPPEATPSQLVHRTSGKATVEPQATHTDRHITDGQITGQTHRHIVPSSGQARPSHKSPHSSRRNNRRRYQTLPHRTSGPQPTSHGPAVHRSSSLSDADVIDLTVGHDGGQTQHSRMGSQGSGQTPSQLRGHDSGHRQHSRMISHDGETQPLHTSRPVSRSTSPLSSSHDGQTQHSRLHSHGGGQLSSRIGGHDGEMQPLRTSRPVSRGCTSPLSSSHDGQTQHSRLRSHDGGQLPSRIGGHDGEMQPLRVSRPVSRGSTSPLSSSPGSDDEVLLISELPTPLVERLQRAASVPGPPTPPARRNVFSRKGQLPGPQPRLELPGTNMSNPGLSPSRQVRRRASPKAGAAGDSLDPDSAHPQPLHSPEIAQEFSNIRITARGRSPTIKGIKKSKSLPEFEHVMIKAAESSPGPEDQLLVTTATSRVRSLEDICQDQQPISKPARPRKRSLTFMSSVSSLWNTLKPSVSISALLGGPGRREEQEGGRADNPAGSYRRRTGSGKHRHVSTGAITDISRALSPSTDRPSSREPADIHQSLRSPSTERPSPRQPADIHQSLRSPTTDRPSSRQPADIRQSLRSPSTERPSPRQPADIHQSLRSPTTDRPSSRQPADIRQSLRSPSTERPSPRQPADIHQSLRSPSTDRPSSRQPADIHQSQLISTAASTALEAEFLRDADLEVNNGKRRNNMSPTEMTLSPPKQISGGNASHTHDSAAAMHRNQRLRTSKKRREEMAAQAHTEQEKQNVRKIAQELIHFMQNHQGAGVIPSSGRRSTPAGGQGAGMTMPSGRKSTPPEGQVAVTPPSGRRSTPPGGQGYLVCAGHGGQLTRQSLPRARAASFEGTDRHRQTGRFQPEPLRRGLSVPQEHRPAEQGYYEYSVDEVILL